MLRLRPTREDLIDRAVRATLFNRYRWLSRLMRSAVAVAFFRQVDNV